MKKIKESNKISKPVFLLLFLLCCGINLFSQYSIKNEENVMTKKELKSLQKVIDYQLEFYNRAFPDSIMDKSSVNVTVFNNYAKYLVFQKERFGYIMPNSSGFYSFGSKEVIVCKEKYEESFLNTCYHELSHFFIASRMNTPPVWLNEGLATYFDNIEVSKSVKHRRNIYYRARVKTMLELKDFNLKDFIDWNYEKFRDISFSQDSYGYALAYCMVYFLMQNEETIIAVINNIYKSKSSYEALENSYNGGFEAFERDFIQSMGKLKSPEINQDFVYSLPVKSGEIIQATPKKVNSNGFTLIFDLSHAGDTIYACREGRVSEDSVSKGNMINNKIVIRHKDNSFSEYSQFEKLLVFKYDYVKLGQPVAVNTGKNLPKTVNFAVYYKDEYKAKYWNWYKYSHIIPVFHTLNAGDVKLEENTTYVGGEMNKHLLTQDGFDLFSQHSIKDEESVLTKKENQILQKVIDYQLEFYNKAFPDSVMEKSSAKLTVFNNRTDYVDYVARNEGADREGLQYSASYYSVKNKEAIICKEGAEASFLTSGFYLLSRFFLTNRIETPPEWLNTGLSEYFSNIKVDNKSIKHERNSWRMVQLKTMLELKEYDLKDFMDWDAEKFHSTSSLNSWHVFALAYGMVSFLMQNEETMITVINNIYKGKSSYEALDSSYKGGFAAFEKDFMRNFGELKTLKINTNFAYSLPVKPGDSIQAVLKKNSIGFTLIFDLSSAGDTIYACREGVVYSGQTSNENPGDNRIIIKHDDDSFSEYFQFEGLLVSTGDYVKSGQPIAVNTGKTISKALGFAVYFIDENKVQTPWIGYKCSHIVPVFHTLNAGNVKLERNTTYIGGVSEQVLIQEINEKQKNKRE